MRERDTYEAREIGAFLRMQRMNTEPPEHFRTARKRHRPYLTQQELADRAGVSVVLIGQIESGRYQNLNAPLLSRLCQALELSPDDEQYIVRLLDAPKEPAVQLYPDIPDMVRSVVDSAGNIPAMIITPRFDILYWNDAAIRLMLDFNTLPLSMRNVVVTMFSIPEMRSMWVDWEKNAENLVSGLRGMMSHVPSHRMLIQELADEMRAKHPDFARWWREAPPMIKPLQNKDFIHPKVGLLRLYQTASQVVGAEQFSILQFSPRDPATADAFTRM